MRNIGLKNTTSREPFVQLDILNPTLRIIEGVNTTLTGLMGFRAYKSADFPEVICDKNYFFIYGTDHAEGIIKWGKGDFIDLRDFLEVGTILSGWQAETPFLMRVPAAECGDTQVLHFFYHTQQETGHTVGQETRLKTSAGGYLHDSTIWTDRGRPLGVVGDENHTGYFKCYKRGVNDYVGIHLTKSATPPEYKVSLSTDGRTWTRSYVYDLDLGLDAGYFVKPSIGCFFEKYNQLWFIGTIEPAGGSPDIFSVDKNLMLAKADSTYQIIDQVALLNQGEYGRLFEATIEGDTAHVYLQNPINKVWHASYDLRNLKYYL